MRHLVLCSTLLLSSAIPAFAQSRWKEIGKTASNNSVYIDPASVKTVKGIITARVQVKFTEPVKTPRGDWKLSRHVVMFDCAKRTVAAKSSTYYGDVAATKIIESKTLAQPGFGTVFVGSMTQIALDYVCKK